MDRSSRTKWRSLRFLSWGEGLEGRQLLSGSFPPYIPQAELKALITVPNGNPAVRPNLPVMPFGTPTSAAPTYIDPTVQITNGYAVIVGGGNSFIAPYAKLNAHGGVIKIGGATAILDNASIVANPLHPHTAPAPEVLIGNGLVIGYGAQVLGPSAIGSYVPGAPQTGIGPGAVIDQATIQPGAYVSALARVGPGITIPTGKLVLPGQSVTSAADLSNPAKVVSTTGTAEARQIVSELNQLRTTNVSLAPGYAFLYQGQSATGASPGVPANVTTVFNGNLAAVRGAGQQPAGTTAAPAVGVGPTFPSPHLVQVQQGKVVPVQVRGLLSGFRARVTGGVAFKTSAHEVAHHLGRSNSILADQGQPPIAQQAINIGSIAQTGSGVTINAPLSATVTVRRRSPSARTSEPDGRGDHGWSR